MVMHRLSLGRGALAGLGLSFLYLNLVPATPAAAQAAPTPDQSYYWCRRMMSVHGANTWYVSRILVNKNPIARGIAQDVIGQAFVRYLIKTYPPDRPKDEESTFQVWSYACYTSWPYGYTAVKGQMDRLVAVGAVVVNWEYTPDQDAPPPNAAQPAPAVQSASEAAIAEHCQYIRNAFKLQKCREQWGGQSAQAAATPAPTPHPATAPAPAPHPPAAQSHTVVATAAPPPAPQPPKSPYVVCIAEHDPHTKYINPPVDGGSGNASTWMKAYRAYLQPRYQYRGPIRCNRQPTRDAAQAFYLKTLDETRAPTGNGGVAPKIVVTDWK